MRRLRLAVLAVLALLLLAAALLWMLPAEVALRLAGDRLQPLALEGVSGSAWNGRALEARWLGQPLGPLRWRLSPLPLLGGALVADLRLEGGRGAEGQAHLRTEGDHAHLSEVQLSLPAHLLEPALDVPALSLRGHVHLEIEHAHLLGGVPQSLAGEAVWKDAAVAGAAAAELGDLVLRFAPAAAGGVAGTLQDLGGPLAAEGDFHVSPAGYRVRARLAARDGNPQVREALAWVGQPQADGSALLLIEGRFLPW